MPNGKLSPLIGYGAAFAIEAVSTGLAAMVQHAVPTVNIRTQYVVAIGAIAYYFGAGPAAFGFVLGFIEWALFLLPPVILGWPPALDPGWSMATSLMVTTAVAGVAMLAYRDSTMRASLLASEVSDALEREKCFSHLLQRALLPGHPTIGDDYEVSVNYVPLYTSREIGGDFYDVFAHNEELAVIVIGDVSGKGLEAASLAAATRSTLHAFIHQTSSAADALALSNSVLYSGLVPEDSFVTVFLAVLHRPSGRFTYSSAGHPPPVIARADGRTDVLEETNAPPLGILDVKTFPKFYNHLEPGDRLVLYTDGISEAHRDGELFDIEGIRRTVADARNLSAAELVDRLIADAASWAKGGLSDDAVVGVVERSTE